MGTVQEKLAPYIPSSSLVLLISCSWFNCCCFYSCILIFKSVVGPRVCVKRIG